MPMKPKQESSPYWTAHCWACGHPMRPEGTECVFQERYHKGRGLCVKCYKVWQKKQNPVKNKPQPSTLQNCKMCSALMVPNGADNLGQFKVHHARGLCTRCYDRERRSSAEIHT